MPGSSNFWPAFPSGELMVTYAVSADSNVKSLFGSGLSPISRNGGRSWGQPSY